MPALLLHHLRSSFMAGNHIRFISSHSTALDSVTGGFFYDPTTPLRHHLVHSTDVYGPCGGHWLMREMQSHAVQTPHPDLERLMMARKKGVCQIIKACVAVRTRIALACRCRVIKAALMTWVDWHEVPARPSGQRNARMVWEHCASSIRCVRLTCPTGRLAGVGIGDAIRIRHPHIPRPWNPRRASSQIFSGSI